MAKINDGTLVDFNDGDKMTSDLYEQDRRIMQVAINDNDTKIGNLQTDQNGLSSRVTAVETKNTGQDNRLAIVESRATGVENRMTTAEGNINTLTTNVNTLTPKVADLEENDTLQDGKLGDLESSVYGSLAPSTFNGLTEMDMTFDQMRIGYVDNKLAPITSALADIVKNVKTKGAKGDFNVSTQTGTDDTAAIQSALDDAYNNAAALGTLYSQSGQPEYLRNIVEVMLPNGIFYVNGTLTIKGWVTLKGGIATTIVFGPNGKINSSLVMTSIQGIQFASINRNALAIEFQKNNTINPQDVDTGICKVEHCFFKNFQTVFTFKSADSTFPTNFNFYHNRVVNCTKLTDRIASDKAEIKHNSFTALFDNNIAYITNYDTLHVEDNIFTPQDVTTGASPEITGMRWFDNYYKLTVKNNRFGDEQLNEGINFMTAKQAVCVRNYADITTTSAIVGTGNDVRETDNNKYFLIIEDNQIYSRNVACVEFYGLPAYFKFIGNTGLVGTRWNADFDITNTDTKLFDFTHAPNISGSFQTWRKFIRFEIKLASESGVFSDALNNQLKLPTPYNVFMVNEVSDNFANKYMPAVSASAGLTQFDIKVDYLPQSFSGVITFYGEPTGDGSVAIAKYYLYSRYYFDIGTGSFTRQLLLSTIQTYASQVGTGAIGAPAINYSGYGSGGATTTDPLNTTMRFKLTNLCQDGSPLKAYAHLRLDV